MWLLWKAFFLDILNKHASIVNIKIKHSELPYITSNLRKPIGQRDYLGGKTKKMGSKYLRKTYSHISTKMNASLYRIRKNYCPRKIEAHIGDIKDVEDSKAAHWGTEESGIYRQDR